MRNNPPPTQLSHAAPQNGDDRLASSVTNANAAAAFAPKPEATQASCCRQSVHTSQTTWPLRAWWIWAVDLSDNLTTFTVFPWAPLPCRIQGSIVATAPCLFIPAAAAAILGRQRRGLRRCERTIPHVLPVSLLTACWHTVPFCRLLWLFIRQEYDERVTSPCHCCQLLFIDRIMTEWHTSSASRREPETLWCQLPASKCVRSATKQVWTRMP